MNTERNAGRVVLGFLLSLFMVISLFVACLIISLKLSVFKGNNINDLLDNIGFHSTVKSVIVTEIKNQVSSGDNAIGSLSEEAVEAIFTEEVVKDVTTSITDAITEDKEIDFTTVKSNCVDTVNDIADKAIDEIIDELKSTSNVVDKESLTNSTTLMQYQKDYNVDITTTIMEQMNTIYGTFSVNLDEIDLEEVKTEAKQAVKNNVIPTIEKQMDTYIEEANVAVNNEIRSIKDENDLDFLTNMIEFVMSLIVIALITAIIVFVLFAVLQIFVVYKKEKHRAFQNIAISSLIVGIIMFAIVAALEVVESAVSNMFSGDAMADMIQRFVDTNLKSLSQSYIITTVILFVMYVLFLEVSKFIEKRSSNAVNQDNIEMME